MSSEGENWEEGWVVWPAVGLVASGCLLWLTLGFTASAKPVQPSAQLHQLAGDPAATPGVEQLDELGKFIAGIKKFAPTVAIVPRNDYVDGSELPIPTVDMKTHFRPGGDATDLMGIVLALDAQNPRRPVPGEQEWELKTYTAPKSGATYMEVDFFNVKQGYAPEASRLMRSWNLSEQVPALAKVPPADWTQDERQYVHYLTKRAMGFDGTELGFSALTAAYASNFNLSTGKRRTVSGAAYYALAASEFEQHLAAGGPPTQLTTAVTWMICGECYRLLGRMDDARRCFQQARQLAQPKGAPAVLRPPEVQILDWEFEQLQVQDMTLQRNPLSDSRTPPTGWYIDSLLPAINADLDVERGKWAQYTDSGAIRDAINATIAAKRAQ